VSVGRVTHAADSALFSEEPRRAADGKEQLSFCEATKSAKNAFLHPWVAPLGRKLGRETMPNAKVNAPAWAGSVSMPGPGMISEENKPIRLIFVDDDDDYREAATAELIDLGFVVESFGGGASMLASVADGLDADVVVLDWGMPTISGIELLPRLRREGIQLPVVFLTGRSSPNHEHLAFDRGALDFVDKSRGVPILSQSASAPSSNPPSGHQSYRSMRTSIAAA